MRSRSIVLVAALVGAMAASAAFTPPAFCNGLDCPVYDVLKTYPTFEIRHYPAQMWSSVNVTTGDMPYEKVVNYGFQLLFNYISGANVNKQKVEMAAPVSVDIYPAAGPACNSTFIVSFFVPFALQSNPVAPTDPNVFIRASPDRTVAVRSFGGFMSTYPTSIQPQFEQLGTDLMAQGININTTFQTTNGYDSPFKRTCSLL